MRKLPSSSDSVFLPRNDDQSISSNRHGGKIISAGRMQTRYGGPLHVKKCVSGVCNFNSDQVS